jgi:hypothetical protein
MAEDTLVPGDTGLTAEAEIAQGGRRRSKGNRDNQPLEVLDELAQETKRTALLDRVEHQLKGKLHVSRALVALEINEEKQTPATIDQKFRSWQKEQEGQAEDLGGLMVFVPGAAINIFEGPTDLIFKALEFMYSLCGHQEADDKLDPANPLAASGPLVTSLRILHFTELRGVRTSKSWCYVINPSKPQGGNQVQMDEENSAEFVYATYNKLLLVCLKVLEDQPRAKGQDLQPAYKRLTEQMPGVDEVSAFLAKGIAESFFTYPEFEKVFVAPFSLVLHSELLWPMPPQLSY